MDNLQFSIKAINTDKFDRPRTVWDKISYWYWHSVWNSLPWSFRECYYTTRDFFFPRHRWLTKKIPNGWRDKDTIIETCLIECVKHFVSPEGEDALGFLSHEGSEHQARFMKELQSTHLLITEKLPELERQLQVAWDNVPHRSFRDINEGVAKDEFEKIYGEINRLEQEVEAVKDLILEWVVKNRKDMWT